MTGSIIGCNVANPFAPANAKAPEEIKDFHVADVQFQRFAQRKPLGNLGKTFFFMLFFVCKTLLYRLFAYTDFFNA